ncbi:DHS-like NAD/FAD-binding domain-containing protein [Polychaeton citri CBS 116435]|uniref:DHS-like NAD/FAD-binding domain-containing protein n=1 Tax=Polychaeton citri CBS 116435 TaxID=1314669 RepID=A0A9P4UTI6_9PEZI|nr:DHS-like NAD/FAD-binding domain-containing protein [Polychaeton citri CBS 116435]
MPAPSDDIASFHEHLQGSKRILALLGAGISAASGLPTFRGQGGLWRTHPGPSLANEEAFARDPSLVWQFYNYRRHMALQVSPNAAHYALAALARKNPNFQTLSQNVDGLSQRAQHPPSQLQLLHGTLFEISCFRNSCSYRRVDFVDPVVPALKIPEGGRDPTTNEAIEADISDAGVPIPKIPTSELPQCPECAEKRRPSLLRPGVVWFGEALPHDVLDKVDSFINEPEDVDLIIVIGTSAQVFPAAGYIQEAREKGARVAVVNIDNDAPPGGWQKGDWFFKGDASEIVPKLLEPVIGDIGVSAR